MITTERGDGPRPEPASWWLTAMWTELFEVKNRYVAELWRELFNAEGVAVRVVNVGNPASVSDMTPRKLFVPDSKTHVAAEILRKI